MLFAEQVVDSLYRIECGYRNLNKKGNPVSHCSIPKTGKFLRLEGLGTFGLFADESRHGVDKLSQVEVSATVVAGATDKVDRIEMG